nr:hypothetical protein [uncultured bacterium]
MKIGILPLGRPTFDVSYAQEKLTGMLAALDVTGHTICGPRNLLFDAAETRAALDDLGSQSVDRLLLLQVTFTDASMTVEAANAIDVPLSIWAVPEPRIGGRLRLNAFCGLNLASHALGLAGKRFSWMYADPDDQVGPRLATMLDDVEGVLPMSVTEQTPKGSERAEEIVRTVRGKRIGRIGEHPVGFDTCAYDAENLKALTGVEVDALEIDGLFDTARNAKRGEVSNVRKLVAADLFNLDQVDQQELDRSLRLKVALDEIRGRAKYDAFAIRCWPETFTEYGGAVCGPVSMLGEARVPCACEADVYGAVTQLILQEAAQEPVFLADLVDMDIDDGTGVVWHCGQAPLSMRDDAVAAQATVHTNRKMPLLYEFTLKPGRVTFLRLSQAHGQTRFVIASGKMLRRPMAFTGTSGVVRFDNPVGDVLNNVMASGLEHHMALAYGDHRELLRQVAGVMGLPVLEL